MQIENVHEMVVRCDEIHFYCSQTDHVNKIFLGNHKNLKELCFAERALLQT